MKPETIGKILNFLKEKESRAVPEGWSSAKEKLKIIESFKMHSDNIQYKYADTIDLSYSIITKLPNDLHVDGGLYLDHCKQLTKLPDKLYVDGAFDISYSNVKKLPNNLYVGEDLILEFCDVYMVEFTNNLYVVGDLFIAGTILDEIYTDEQIREIVASNGGKINGYIHR